jgi:pilus assembly protein CpaC
MKAFKKPFCRVRPVPACVMQPLRLKRCLYQALKHVINWATFLIIAVFPPLTGAQEPTRIDLEMGASTVLKLKGVTRIAVGNSQIVQVTTVNPREVLVFGKTRGSTTVDIWISEKNRRTYRIFVTPEGLSRVQEEITRLLKNIPQAHSRIAGDKLVIEGEDLNDADQLRIATLAKRYPEVIDFTSQLGWDKMILLDVQVLELPSSRMQELGVRWDPTSQSGVQTGLAWEGGSTGLMQRPGEAGLPVPFPLPQAAGYLGLNALLSARLAALSKSGEAVVLAQPQLLARSGSTASFLAGGEVPYASVDKDGKSTTTFKKYGVSLNITPHADRNAAIRSRIEIEVSSVDTTITVPGGPALKIRKASTEFNVRSGQTLVLGGFISRERSRDQDGLPGVSKIPILGGLFGVKREQERHTELAIFVTPMIVDPRDPGLAARVANAQGVLQESFPAPPMLNTPVNTFGAGQHPTPPNVHETFGQWESEAEATGSSTHPVSQWEE